MIPTKTYVTRQKPSAQPTTEPMYLVALPGTPTATTLRYGERVMKAPTEIRNGQIVLPGTAWAFHTEPEFDGDFHRYYSPANRASKDLRLYEDSEFAELCLQRETLWLELRKYDLTEFLHRQSLYHLQRLAHAIQNDAQTTTILR